MTPLNSWLRRVRRTLRVCLVSSLLLVMWSFIQGVVSLQRPLIAGLALVVVTMLFVWWHWLRPARLRRRRGPADLRLRKIPRAAVRPLAGGIVVTGIALEAMFLLHLRLLPVPAEDPFAEMFAMANEPWGWLPLFLLIVVLAPIIEETVFRGWIQRPLERLWGPAPAVGITALLFALVHFIPEYLPYYFVVGLLLGTLVVLTRSLWASIALHTANNVQSMALMFLGGGDFAEEIAVAQLPAVTVASTLVLIGAGLFLSRTARQLRAIVRPPRPAVSSRVSQPELA